MSDASDVRINELARELEVKAKAIIDLLPGLGVSEKKTHSSSIPLEVAEKVRHQLQGTPEPEPVTEAPKAPAPPPQVKPAAPAAPSHAPAAHPPAVQPAAPHAAAPHAPVVQAHTGTAPAPVKPAAPAAPPSSGGAPVTTPTPAAPVARPAAPAPTAPVKPAAPATAPPSSVPAAPKPAAPEAHWWESRPGSRHGPRKWSPEWPATRAAHAAATGPGRQAFYASTWRCARRSGGLWRHRSSLGTTAWCGTDGIAAGSAHPRTSRDVAASAGQDAAEGRAGKTAVRAQTATAPTADG